MKILIISTCHSIIDARLNRTIVSLLKRNIDVTVSALYNSETLLKNPNLHYQFLSPNRSKVIRIIRDIYTPFKIFKYDALLILDIDLIFFSYIAALIFRKKYIVDIHERYIDLIHDRNINHKSMRFLIGLLIYFLIFIARKTAALIFLADEHVFDKNMYSSNVYVIRNIPNYKDVHIKNTNKDSKDKDKYSAIYIGDVRESRGLYKMIEIFKDVSNWKLHIVGPYDKKYEDYLENIRMEYRNIHIYGRLPLKDSWSIASDCDIGLLLLDSTPAFKNAIPTKYYEYLLYKLPIISSQLPRIEVDIKKYNLGFVVDITDIVMIKNILNNISSKKINLMQIKNNISTFNVSLFSTPYPFDLMANIILKVL